MDVVLVYKTGGSRGGSLRLWQKRSSEHCRKIDFCFRPATFPLPRRFIYFVGGTFLAVNVVFLTATDADEGEEEAQ